MTIHELAPRIQRREVSPVEVTQQVLDRIEALDGRLHSFITVRGEEAMDAARSAERSIVAGNYLGPLHGVPLGIKDNIAVAGWPTTNASQLMCDFITDYDATVVSRLRAAGAIIVGKNNMHEWALGGTSAYSAFGAVHNPWDEARVPGGSSGGSAAAVSASLIYASVGTDYKGSIRIPASFCGVVGLKPTQGLVSRFGQLPATSANTDHLGPIARDVLDAALLLNVLAGYDPNDPTSIDSPDRDYLDGIDRGVAGLRIGVPRAHCFELASEEVRAVVQEAIEVLGSLGAAIVDVSIPSLQHVPVLEAAWVDEGQAYLLPFARHGPFADLGNRYRIVLNEFVRRSDVAKAGRVRTMIQQEYQAALAQVDLLAMPTNVSTPFLIAEAAAAPPARNPARLTMWLNLVGAPTISVPCGFSEGLPVGLMLAGRHWEDDVVLRAAYAYEQAATGGYKMPPIS